jgi:hypothetical protein
MYCTCAVVSMTGRLPPPSPACSSVRAAVISHLETFKMMPSCVSPSMALQPDRACVVGGGVVGVVAERCGGGVQG